MQGHKQRSGERMGDGNEQFELFAQQKGGHNAGPMDFPWITRLLNPFCCGAPASGQIRAQLQLFPDSLFPDSLIPLVQEKLPPLAFPSQDPGSGPRLFRGS